MTSLRYPQGIEAIVPFGVPPAQAEVLVAKARARCAEHLGPLGFCAICFRAELEDLLAQENPALKRDDVVQLVD